MEVLIPPFIMHNLAHHSAFASIFKQIFRRSTFRLSQSSSRKSSEKKLFERRNILLRNESYAKRDAQAVEMK